MSKFYIIGGNSLRGEVEIDSAKNSLLPIIASCALIDGVVEIKKAVQYSDVLSLCQIIESLGGKIEWNDSSLFIDCSSINSGEISHEYSSKTRASFYMFGALLARLKKVKIGFPGGCDIGLRPVDLHIGALESLGCKIVEKNGYIYGWAEQAKAGQIILPFPSVGATENAIIFASSLKGRTEIIGGAREPEVEDLQSFINSAGGFVRGVGGEKIIVEGRELHSTSYTPFPDRIESGTILVATAMCGGKVCLKGAKSVHNRPLLAKLAKIGCNLAIENDKIIIESYGRRQTFGDVETAIYPGFPTDLQSQMVALASISKGTSIVVENLFEARFKIVQELIKMGADIKIKNGVCVIKGKEKLYGADLVCPDLRGGASLTLSALASEGYSTLERIDLIDRGYFKFENKLASLGGDIKRIN